MANIIKTTSNIYHLCSAGNRTDLLFHDNQEFANGMNIVAISAFQSQVEILAFCLMDNHFHFILSANEEEQIIRFSTHITQLYKRRINSKTQERIRWTYFQITSTDYLKHAIAYTLKNPTNAYYTKLPTRYPWSSGRLYFEDISIREEILYSYRTLTDLGIVQTRKVLQTRHLLPGSWHITRGNYIWPGDYIDFQKVENIFNGSPKEFLFYLSATKKDNLQEMYDHQKPISIPDQEMRKHAIELCSENYHHTTLTDLKLSERLYLQKQLILRYGAHRKQTERILHISNGNQ